MNKILKDTYVNPKVELTEEEYNNLVSLAQFKADEIERRAVELYRENGICEMEINVRIDKEVDRWTSDDTYETFTYKFNPWSVRKEENEYEPSPFVINKEMVKRIKEAATSIAEYAFYLRFGEHMKEINNIMAYKRMMERERKRFIVLTVAGWLTGLTAMLIVLLK